MYYSLWKRHRNPVDNTFLKIIPSSNLTHLKHIPKSKIQEDAIHIEAHAFKSFLKD